MIRFDMMRYDRIRYDTVYVRLSSPSASTRPRLDDVLVWWRDAKTSSSLAVGVSVVGLAPGDEM